MKKAQQMRTIFPIGLKEEIKVSTTSFRPGALLMTLEKKKDNKTFDFYPCPVIILLLLLSCLSLTLLYLQAGIFFRQPEHSQTPQMELRQLGRVRRGH